jgi:hypothetical protein
MQVTKIISSTEVTADIPSGARCGMPKTAGEEPGETALFLEFLSLHVRRNRIRSVQRMLLWSEWVRFCWTQIKTFPRTILENRFDDIMTGKLHINVVHVDFFGPVYEGTQFIPKEPLRVVVGHTRRFRSLPLGRIVRTRVRGRWRKKLAAGYRAL